MLQTRAAALATLKKELSTRASQLAQKDAAIISLEKEIATAVRARSGAPAPAATGGFFRMLRSRSSGLSSGPSGELPAASTPSPSRAASMAIPLSFPEEPAASGGGPATPEV